MKTIKFDEDKVRKCIDAYNNMYNREPYLVCNEKTMDIIPEEKPSLSGIAYTVTDNCIGSLYATTPINDVESISINSEKYVKEKTINKNCKKWYGARIIIDNNLKFGEVELR